MFYVWKVVREMEEQKTSIEEIQHSVPKKSTNFLLVGGVILALVVLGGGILLRAGNRPTPSTLPAQTESQEVVDELSDFSVAENTTESEVAEPIVIDVEAGSFYYNPEEIRVKIGDTIRIVLTANDMMHDFNIDELGVDGPVIKAGETTTIDFVADQVGEFEYYCSVVQHRANGQVGMLIVEE
ncbi:hypothetical protein A3F01_03240 [Candidatus Woesebacteria bacterium RIFCSPHIGHO2_12_FULL_38_11]|uniref:Plastocyanin n=1 Tax=Candidatus Woesebacteria bacterium GW2011_GWA1_39_8 TaxID=1618552 RepID=A0A0G0PS80_9BACT|nr:MAG: Plastocyanin [Candidatus Woesebacteria bacterium GW2011_GWA1_39_8]OGM37437.1 MAG: hypothetical protein A3F01_03240 [Candidatus Woesebacteria bacterium RIFCSPHIGHO2_12_FULL_38_11]